MLCDAMKWNHLPMDGGLYDQSPDLIDRFYYIFAERSKEEARKSQERERQMNNKGRGPRVAGRR